MGQGAFAVGQDPRSAPPGEFRPFAVVVFGDSRRYVALGDACVEDTFRISDDVNEPIAARILLIQRLFLALWITSEESG